MWGPSRMKLGTQPLNIHLNPSVRYISASKRGNPLLSEALMTLVLITSTGEQMVVATKPARNEAVKCVVRLSSNDVCVKRARLKPSYDASCEAVMRTARIEFGQAPRHKARNPSSRVMRIRPSIAFL